MRLLLTLLSLLLCVGVMGQSRKPKTYNIKFADTVNIYNNKTIIAIKNTKGGWKYIVVRPQDKWHVDSANVVNQY